MRRSPIWIIVIALLVWGLVLATGAYLGLGDAGGGRDIRKFWIVLGCVAGFLAFWAVALKSRANRLARSQAPPSNSPDSVDKA